MFCRYTCLNLDPALPSLPCHTSKVDFLPEDLADIGKIGVHGYHRRVLDHIDDIPISTIQPTHPSLSQGYGLSGRPPSLHVALSHLLRITFSRAANLVREGMQVDGAAFFDAPIRLSQGHGAVVINLRRLDNPLSESGSSSAGEDYTNVKTSLPSHTRFARNEKKNLHTSHVLADLLRL
jgi:hypothetical protein